MQLAETLPNRYISPTQIIVGEGPAEFMRERTSLMYDMTPIHSPFNTGTYRSKYWYFDRFMFTHVHSEASVVRRSKSQAEAGAGLVAILSYVSGGVRGVMGDLSIDRDPGQMYLVDHARQVDCIQFPNEIHGVFVPKNMIGYDPDQHAPFIRFSDNRVQGALLYRAFNRVFRNVQFQDAVDPTAFDQLLSCLKMCLGSDRRDGDVRRQARDALADMIRSYVDKNLAHPDLSAATILTNFGLSRASLFRMFERDGGFRRFVNRRRVHRAVIDIVSAPPSRGSISAAAERWGLTSAANFNRSVKDQFGVAPGSLVDFPKDDTAYFVPSGKIIGHTLRIQNGQ